MAYESCRHKAILAVVVVPLYLAACGGSDGNGPPGEQLAHVQFELVTYGSLLPTGPTHPLILFDSTPVPSDFVSALELHGFLLTEIGRIDSTTALTISWAIESGGGSLAASATGAEHGQVSNQWFLGPMVPGTVQGVRLTSPEVPAFQQHLRIRVYQGPLQLEQSPAPTTGTLGMTLPDPLTVRVVDANGAPLPRVLVRFFTNGSLTYRGETASATYFTCGVACPPGESSVFAYTDADGSAGVNLTLPTTTLSGATAVPEVPRRLGSSQYLTGGPGVQWQITLPPGPTAQIVIQSGNNQAGSPGGTLALPLLVTVADQYGNVRADEPVTWTVVTGGGSVGSATTTTTATGLASNTWTLGPATGTQTVSAAAGPASVTFFATAGP